MGSYFCYMISPVARGWYIVGEHDWQPFFQAEFVLLFFRGGAHYGYQHSHLIGYERIIHLVPLVLAKGREGFLLLAFIPLPPPS